MVGKLAIGQAIEVTADALSGERFQGVIHKIGSTADPVTRTYQVEVRVDQPRGLRPGMVATVRFARERRAYLLPLTAVAMSPGRSVVVYRVTETDGRTIVKEIPVAFDDVLDNRVAVRMNLGEPGGSGLRPGDRVVATGIHRLHDGEVVKVAE